MKINRKKFGINVAIFVVILYTIMPWVSRFISTYLTTYFFMIVVGIVFAYTLISSGRNSFLNNIYTLLPFLIWRCLMLVSAEDILIWFYETVLELLPLILGVFILKYRTETNKTFVIIICVSFFLTTLTTIWGLTVYPDAARWLASVDSSQAEELIRYDWMNIGGYNFVYSVILLYPMLILAYKKKKIGLFCTLICTLSIFALVLTAGYTIALLFFFISSSLFVFRRDTGWKGILFFLVAIILISILANAYMSDVFEWLSMKIENDAISYRLQLLAGGRNAIANSDDNRLELYSKSIKAFLNDPFFGTMFAQNEKAGGHSFILDFFASYGVIGVGCLFFMYYKIYSIYYRPYRCFQGYGFFLWCFIQAIALSTVNTGMWLYVLTLFIPCLGQWIFDNEIEKSINTENMVDIGDMLSYKVIDKNYILKYRLRCMRK